MKLKLETRSTRCSSGPEHSVLRSDPFSVDHLVDHARKLVTGLEVSPLIEAGGLRERFQENAQIIRRAHACLAAAVRDGEPITPDAEWLLDNFYVVEEQLREVVDDLPPRFYRELPKLPSGRPRIYALALELLVHRDSALDEESIVRFVRAFQEHSPLSIGETWAFPIMLRVALLENLRRLASQMLMTRDCSATARRHVQSGALDRLFALLGESLEESAPLLLQVVEQVESLGHEAVDHIKRLERELTGRGWSIEDAVRCEHQRQAANQVSIGNVITSMRLISSLDWVAFFERTNLADATLRRDPAQVYARMDFPTRDRYRHVVDELSKRSGWTDIAIAERAIDLAAQSTSASPAARHVGYFLVDKGRDRLESEISYRPATSQYLVRWIVSHPQLVFLGGIFLTTFALLALLVSTAMKGGASIVAAMLMALIGILPASELSLSLVNLLITHLLRPRLIPKLAFEEGVPPEWSTFVVMPSMLTGKREIDTLVDRLQMHYLANPEPSLRFALLTDFADAPEEHMPGDGELIAHAERRIAALNQEHGSNGWGPFYLFHRARKWNAVEGTWMGWERKRGKLMEFNRLLRGASDTSYSVQAGDCESLRNATNKVVFVITLDADTQLPHGSARRLIGTLAHPLNRPQIDASSGRFTAGYCLLQPRLIVHLGSANRSWFSWLVANSPGIDPYSTCASDVYQDLFGEGSFTGKGIYDVEAFETSLAGVFPENAILSHDLIEGCHTRVALVSDIELVDGLPARYDADSHRQQRWVRGDWQLIPWLLPRVPSATGWRSNRLSVLDRWKIFDNLRRSLVAPFLLAFFVVGWTAAPALAWLWTLAGVTVCAFPFVWQLSAALGRAGWAALQLNWRGSNSQDLLRSLLQCVVTLVLLPHKAWVSTDAVVRTVYRVTISRRPLLEWETAAAAERRLASGQREDFWLLWFAPLLAVTLALILTVTSRTALVAASLVLIGWLLAPLLARWLNRPIVAATYQLTLSDRQSLRRLARKTWAFFEAFVGADDHWLPPDNFQEYPGEKIAHRISPTNEGLFLLSALVARDFGFVPLYGLAQLLERNLESWRRFDRYRGHFYNWYDTLTLAPLKPRYVSTVDSGNLAAAFLTLREGLDELLAAPVVGAELWQGLTDSIDEVEQSCRALQPRGAHLVDPPLDALGAALAALRCEEPQGLHEWRPALGNLQRGAATLAVRRDEFVAAGRYPETDLAPKVEHLISYLEGLSQDFGALFPWTGVLDDAGLMGLGESGTPLEPFSNDIYSDSCRTVWGRICKLLLDSHSLASLSRLDEAVAADFVELRALLAQLDVMHHDPAERWLDRLQTALHSGALASQHLSQRFRELGATLEILAREMDFRFLYNPQRRLFSIGYNLEEGALDRAHYDLLCSEARLASYLAIAKGDVEYRHWFQLGRPVTQTAGRTSLLSWGGTMFEYLLPSLFQKCEPGSLLDESCRAAVARQIEYGRQRDVPWGISECAFGALASNSDYHYQSFGVPGLGLKRGLAKDLVVSPYSTMLACETDPQAALRNVESLIQEGGLGWWGLYDAIDYSPERLPAGKKSIVVRCYMSHHQGMSLVALGNLLCDGSTRRRFAAHPLGRSCELLLEERRPVGGMELQPHAEEVETPPAVSPEQELVSRRVAGVDTGPPRTHLLSNGQYAIMLSHTGGGYSRWRDTAVTRWRPDATCDHWGQFIYLRNVQTGRVWSATYQPTRVQPDSYEVVYSIDKAEYRRKDREIETHLEIVVSPENNAEVRQVKLTNHGSESVEIELTSFSEVVLTTASADLAHPAFQKLFVETDYFADESALLARRRPRDAREASLWSWHALAPDGGSAGNVEFETSRKAFLGRLGTISSPAALHTPLTGRLGTVLDPIFSLRCRVRIAPRAAATVAFVTGVADSRDQAMALADQYHDHRGVQRAFELAWAYNQVELRHWHVSPAQSHLYQRLASLLLYADPSRRATQEVLMANRQGQSGLWRYGISGDVPLMVAHISRPENVPHVQELIAARQFWRRNGLIVDLAILNDYPGSYLDALNEQLVNVIQASQYQSDERPGGIYLLRGAQIPREDQVLLESAANVVWNTERGSIAQQLSRPVTAARAEPSPIARRKRLAATRLRELPDSRSNGAVHPATWSLKTHDQRGHLKPPPNLELWNGIGGFADDGQSYLIRTQAASAPPMPWANVIANPRCGCLVTESGGGCTWAENSREFKLTPWANDPIADRPSEILFLRDEETGELLSPADRRSGADFVQVKHGAGYSTFEETAGDIGVRTTVAVAADDPVKFLLVRLENQGKHRRTVSLTCYVEWVLGVVREQSQLHIVTAVDPSSGALTARNAYQTEFSDRVAFLHVVAEEHSWTGDRTEFLGRYGDWRKPLAMDDASLSGTTGAGLDPCGALRTPVALAPGEQREVAFLLGAGGGEQEVRTLIERYSTAERVRDEIETARSHWDETLDAVQIRTPLRSLDILFNRWLMYQTLSCRIWGRSALYQSGGAYGFRDQLQDVMAVVYTRPEIARQHILRSAARQFEEGDVQHWWHPPAGRGTRTRFSDDYLWLPLSACHYATVTGDYTIWDEVVPFLVSPPLQPEEEERYELPQVATESATLYEHCLRAVSRAFRLGPHGLPLMGCGDWNDGMNKIGSLGQGESVWVGWFLLVVIEQFTPVMHQRSAGERAEQFRARAADLRQALEHHGWDGDWYLRAFFDDGTPLGSRTNEECRIDSIVQSWAVIAGADPVRTRLAMRNVSEFLLKEPENVALLFTPPFDQGPLQPGYVKGYPPGIRENGGQYTHAATWLVRAFARLGDADNAVRVLQMLNPLEHSATPEDVEKYQVEPYVVAADVYGVEPHTGRGGWTWYTGSSAWMYRVILEDVLGFELRGSRLAIKPCIPASWPGFEITFRRGQATFHIHVVHEQNSERSPRITFDGENCDGNECELPSDGNHDITVYWSPPAVMDVRREVDPGELVDASAGVTESAESTGR